MTYMNEFDPFAAAWLRKLIEAGQLSDPTQLVDVDERDIREVKGVDLDWYQQCHFFAGIAGWPLALRIAGWPAGREVWSGSCPCPPFSAAGKKKRCPECGGARPVPCPVTTGHFICVECEHAWLADERHLWPEFWRLIAERRPATVFGEQVGGADGLIWFAGVRATLEAIGYSVGCLDLAAASVGAPHIRQRLFWVADARRIAPVEPGNILPAESTGRHARDDAGIGGESRGLGDAIIPRLEGHAGHGDDGHQPGRERADTGGPASKASGVGAAWVRCECCDEFWCRIHGQHAFECECPAIDEWGDVDSYSGGLEHTTGGREQRRAETNGRSVASGCGLGGLAYAKGRLAGDRGLQPGGEHGQQPEDGGSGFWSDYSTVYCRDGKTRRIEPGTFPLVVGATNRVGLLRGYGNAIVVPLAVEFIKAFLETEIERR